MGLLPEETCEYHSDRDGLAYPARGGTGRQSSGPFRKRQDLVQGGFVGDEAPLAERSACGLDLLRGELQVARDRARGVVAEPLVITDQHEEEVEEDLAGLEPYKVALADQAMVNPAEGPRDLPHTLRPEQPFRRRTHGAEGSHRPPRRRSGPGYRRGPGSGTRR